MDTFKVYSGVGQFCIEAPNGEESAPLDWDEVAAVRIGNDIYICHGKYEDEEQTVEKVLTTTTVPTETVHVLFEGEVEPSDDELQTPGLGGDEQEEEEEEEEEDEDEDEDDGGPEPVA